MSSRERVLDHIRAERERQVAQYGDVRHDDALWRLVLTGEVGEAAQTALRNYLDEHPRMAEDHQALYDELIQVAAVVVAWAETVYRRMGSYGQPPLGPRQSHRSTR